MAYTIKGLAKANECENLSESGLADIWEYWIICNCCDKQSVNDFKRLRKADQKVMLEFLRTNACYSTVYNHIVKHIYD